MREILFVVYKLYHPLYIEQNIFSSGPPNVKIN